MHTHEFDCVVCGEHFDDERALQRHNSESHAPKQAIDVHAPAEPMGTEHARHKNAEVNPSATADRNSPRYGSAGGGGAEFEPGPERD
jgi:hypothetical protein